MDDTNWWQVLCSVLLVLSLQNVAADDKCSGSEGTTITNLSFASHRNSTGHWIVTVKAVRVDQQHDTGNSHLGEVFVDLEHTAKRCADSHTAQLWGTAIIPMETVITQGHTGEEQLRNKSNIRASTPPDGYKKVDGLGYYKMHVNGATWLRARDTCVSEGGHLIIINSEEEAQMAKTLHAQNVANIKNSGSSLFIFVGIHDLYNEGEFITVLGEPLSTTGCTKWSSGQPNEGSSANCVYMNQQGEYYDQQCTYKSAFICEYSL